MGRVLPEAGTLPRLAVSIGCPSGIGPEVSLAGAVAMARHARVLLVGDLGVLRAAAKLLAIDPARLVAFSDPNKDFLALPAFEKTAPDTIAVFQPSKPLLAKDRKPGKPSRVGGAAQLAWIDAATDLVRDGHADALVTGPVSKDAIARSGAPRSEAFRGHTEHLAARLHAPEVTMAFWTEKLTTSLVTTHLSLANVPRAITKEEVARATYWTSRFVAKLDEAKEGASKRGKSGRGPVASRAKPLVIAGLNPHAGEHGLLGSEEDDAITPGIALARRRLEKDRVALELHGPVPAESAFRRAANGDFSAVVAMYHDQATIPMKLLGFGEAVNISLGLPIVRTSVDHGTAYDRAGKGTADARGMIEAMKLALRLVSRPPRPDGR